jgi:hypothetical protein
MKPLNKTRWTLVALVIGPLAVAILGWTVVQNSFSVMRTYAHYDGLAFRGEAGKYWTVDVSSPSESNLFIHVPGHGPIAVRELTEDMVLEWLKPVGERRGAHVYVGEGASFTFRNRRLVSLDTGRELQFSAHKDGPWLTLPVEYERLHEVFGQPDRRERKRESRPYRFI